MTSLPRDPQTNIDRIDELARRILAGDILLPKFQRQFVWDKKRIIALLDSVSKMYPIGSILLWCTRQELKSEHKIANLDVVNPRKEYPYNYLLDGQQRLSTICGALYWKGSDADDVWNIAYDLRKEEFFHPKTLEKLEIHQIRVNRLSDPSEFFAHVAMLGVSSAPDRDELTARAKRLFDRFKDYKIATVTLGDMELDDVAPIFERINSQGKILTRVDLLRAATWSRDFDLVDSMEKILGALKTRHFDRLDHKTLLRSMAAALDGGFSMADTEKLRGRDSDAMKAVVATTREAYKRTVDFLVAEIGAVNSRVIPYTHQVMVLAEVMRRIPSPSSAQFSAMKAWFWQTSISRYFSGWNSSQMRTDFDAIASFAALKSLHLPAPKFRPPPKVWRETMFRGSSALCKTYALMLSHCKPRDLLTGIHVDTSVALAWQNQKEFHHLFPRKYLSSKVALDAPANSMANIVFLSSSSNKNISAQSPSSYLKKAEAVHGDRWESVLASNLITPEAYEAALKNDFFAFLDLRARAIDQYANSLARWPQQTPVVGDVSDTDGDAEDE